MKNTTFLALIASTAILSGCSSIPQNAVTKVELFSEPDENIVVESYVGERMMSQGRSETDEYLIIRQSIDGVGYDIPRGEYRKKGEDKLKFFNIFSKDGGMVTHNVFADPPLALSLNTKKQVCITTPYIRETTCYDSPGATVQRRAVVSDQSFQQTLIYSGLVGDKINISYREFSGGLARSAFTNSVEYDLSKSKTINYKGAVIDVISADNTKIKYIVKKHMRTSDEYNMTR